MSERDDDITRILCEFMDRRLEGGDVDIRNCAADHPDVADELLRRYEQWLEVEDLLRGGAVGGFAVDSSESGADGDLGKYLAELRRRGASFERYDVVKPLGRGAQGHVFEVYDKDLRRSLAMKILDRDLRNVETVALARFLDEAQVMGQLDHPGIVPVHDVGVDPENRLFFTMKLVRGESLAGVIERRRLGEAEISLTRVLSHLLNVCHAVAYAHERKVIHRDIKPDNVLIGEHGETYVMDWGLKRLLDGSPEPGEPQDSKPSGRAAPRVASLRQELARMEGSPVASLPGGIAGTLFYMSPEQARGDQDRIREATDIYAVGAILYEVISSAKPYADGDPALTVERVLRRICNEPPTPLQDLEPDVPPELEAIVERAMQRDPARRYPTMSAIAADLQSFLEGRVVGAYETGALAQARKWIARNRKLSLAVASAVLILFASIALFAFTKSRHNRDLVAKNVEITSLSDRRILADLVTSAAELWPIHPASIPRMEAWLERVDQLARRMPGHEQDFARLVASVPAQTAEQSAAERELHPSYPELRDTIADLDGIEFAIVDAESDPATRDHLIERKRRLNARLAELQRVTAVRRRFEIGDAAASWQLEQLAALVYDYRAFADPEHGLAAWVKRRVAASREIEPATIGRYASEWRTASEKIASRGSPYYDLALEPQLGLVPLGEDPSSGLAEFHVHGTGEPAVRDPASGQLRIGRETGMVLVLLPGGAFRMGARAPAPGEPELGPNVEPSHPPSSAPVHEVSLAPFFLSKYEMTQGQWERMDGGRPSAQPEDPGHVGALPVERVSYTDCVAVLERLSLELPTEAQWEYAARAGTSTRWWCGDDESRLAECANIADQALEREAVGKDWQFDAWDDGIIENGPVDALEPNPFGFHLVIGNVWEWCIDGTEDESNPGIVSSYQFPVEPLTGRRLFVSTGKRVVRGGAHQFLASHARSASRQFRLPDARANTMGVRPARRIDAGP